MTTRNIDELSLFERSGRICSSDPLVSFLYYLMRDHVPPGALEGILKHACAKTTTTYTNGFLAQYAMDIARRLRD